MKRFLLLTLFWINFASASPFPDTIQPNSLLHHAYRVYSQYGEEGVLDVIFQRLGIERGFLVEFGGYDGVNMSNTRVLAERGWSGAFIESNDNFYRMMVENFRTLPNIQCIKEYISPFENDPQGKTFDAIADAYFPNQEIDVLSIDIDGLDHLIFKNLKRKPKLIIIEGGMFWHPMMQLEVPDEIAALNVQQPIIVMNHYANDQGYQLICSTFNAFFIRNDLYHHFTAINNNPSLIWWEAMLHMKNIASYFYNVDFQIIRRFEWIQDWERKDPNITFQVP